MDAPRGNPIQWALCLVGAQKTKKRMNTPKHYLVVDLEATCADDGTVPKHEMEIIEIGAVMVAALDLEPVGEFQTFVRPVRHPQLTRFCTELTSITQAEVDAAPAFAPAMKAFCSWAYTFDDILFCSWGDYDRKQFRQDCLHHDVGYPFGSGHLNVKRAFAKHGRRRKAPGMAGALEHVGLELTGTHHRGIDDARNIARLLPWALGRVL
jgi:inhibitor of KinA sporulation pathway (predicted exonuclease)